MRATLRLDPGEVRDAVAAVVAAALAGLILGVAVPNMILGFTNSFYSGPIVLDAQEFEEMVANRSSFAVMFSSDNCPTCKKMEPFWRDLAEEGLQVYIIKLSADTFYIFQRYEVAATPTFIVFKEGEPVAMHTGTFNGPDIKAEMRSWIEAALAKEIGDPTTVTVGGTLSKISGLNVETQATPLAVVSLLIAGVVAGFAVSASPCTLPALALYASTFSPTRQGVRFALEASVSAAIALAAVGGLALLLSSLIAGVQSALIYSAAMVLVVLGIAQVMDVDVFLPLTASLPRRPGFAGLAYGLIAGQCSLPLTAATLALAAASPQPAGVALVTGLALGAAAPVALVTLAAGRAQAVAARLDAVRKPLGVVISLAGLLILLYEAGAI